MSESRGQSAAEHSEAERANVTAMIAVLRAVLDIHRPTGSAELWCKECADLDDNGHESSAAWPCKTVRAILDGGHRWGPRQAQLTRVGPGGCILPPLPPEAHVGPPRRRRRDTKSGVQEHRPIVAAGMPACACGIVPATGVDPIAWHQRHLADLESGGSGAAS